MKQATWMKRLGTLLATLALATFLFGCGQAAPTGVEMQPNQTLGGDLPIDDPPGDGDPTQWW
jgi:hypothetical protein